MLKRYGLSAPREDVREHFAVSGQGGRLPPRYNIAPGQPTFVVVVPPRQSVRRLLPCQWGIPAGSGDRRASAIALEVARRRPEWRELLANQRCLAPATGFYVWRRDGAANRPYHVRRADGGVFGLAAIWREWREATGPPVHGCAALIGPPNDLTAEYAAWAPIIAPPERYQEWLTPKPVDPATLDWLNQPWDPAEFVIYPVPGRVNDPRHDDPGCIARRY